MIAIQNSQSGHTTAEHSQLGREWTAGGLRQQQKKQWAEIRGWSQNGQNFWVFNLPQSPSSDWEICDFLLEPSQKKVTFQGEVGSREGQYKSEESDKFRAEFQFGQFYVVITTSQLGPEEDKYVTLLDKYLEQYGVTELDMLDISQ